MFYFFCRKFQCASHFPFACLLIACVTPVAPSLLTIKTISMKKQLAALINFKLFRRSLFLATSFLLPVMWANAQEATAAPLTGNAVVRHIESQGTTSSFLVLVPNEAGEKFNLVIKNAAGDILFTEIYDDKNFNRRYLLTGIESNARLQFIIRSLKDRKMQTFEASSITRVVEDVVVTRLK